MTPHPATPGAIHIPLAAFEPASGDARLERDSDKVLVVSPSQAWAYAALLRLDRAPLRRGPAVVCVRARVQQGYMGFGILNTARDAFLTEQGARAGADGCEVRLRVDALEQASDLVVRNWAGGDNISRAEIEAVTIEACPPGESQAEVGRRGTARRAASSATPSQYWLVRYVESQVPALTDAAAGDWRRVCALRDWAYANIPAGESKASILEAKYGYGIYDEPVEQILRKLDEGEGGFLCAGMAVVLRRLYELFGYISYTYNMGSPQGSPTHVVCLVDIEHEGRTLTTVQDALFNLSFARGAAPLEFLELLNLLRQRRAGEIDLARGEAAAKPLVGSPESVRRWIEGHRDYYRIEPMVVTAAQARAAHNLSLENYDRRFVFEDWVESQIGEREILYAYLFPLGTSGEPKVAQLAEAARQARARCCVREPG